MAGFLETLRARERFLSDYLDALRAVIRAETEFLERYAELDRPSNLGSGYGNRQRVAARLRGRIAGILKKHGPSTPMEIYHRLQQEDEPIGKSQQDFRTFLSREKRDGRLIKVDDHHYFLESLVTKKTPS